jgi:large subunit ribosomal protein L10
MGTSRRTTAPRPDKVATVDEVRTRFSSADAAILTEYRGLSVKNLAELRRTLRAAGGEYKVYKNTLVRFAARELGIDGLEELLVGPTAIAFIAGDAVGVAKTLRDYARTNPSLVVKGGVLGESLLSAADTAALADIPPRDVLLARLAGMLAAPMQQFAGLLQAVPRGFAYGLAALIEQRGGLPEPEPEAAEALAVAEPEPEAAAAEPDGESASAEASAGDPVAAPDAEAVTESTESPAEPTADTTEEGAQ